MTGEIVTYLQFFVKKVAKLFRQRLSTLDIAEIMDQPESVIYNALAQRERKNVSPS